MKSIIILSAIGFLLSIYAFYVKKNHEKNKSYKPFCDISKKFSCTKAFSSKHGNLIGVSNTLFGIIFYPIVFIFALLNQAQLIFFLSIPALLASLYLAYLSYIKMKNFCLVCSLIYLINFLIFIFSQ
ncbi:hypothetical protein HYV50_05180 [Candidatus Pacearchaeota archaeon]|nr:hypothetical protein [Candidatus Pacearchaeota archaeon]